MNEPVFGMVFLGGPLQGARINHMRVANELAARGFRVHVWWVMDRPRRPAMPSEVRHHWLFSYGRYFTWFRGRPLMDIKDGIAQLLNRLVPEPFWDNMLTSRAGAMELLAKGFFDRFCSGAEKDKVLARRFAAQLEAAGVTHVLPQLSFLSPWVLTARCRMKRPVKYLVTFQGYEVCANYARAIGREEHFYQQLREAVARSDFPAMTLSDRYRQRIARELDISESAIDVIPPTVPSAASIDRDEALRSVAEAFKDFRPEVPLVTYLGRRDAEKGIDLLLYAISMLKRRGLDVQLAVCGPTLHGPGYLEACRLIAENLRLPVLWHGYVSDELRTALYAASHALVLPSIYYEPFGMVPVEAMSYGTPVIVPDTGGIVETVHADGHTGGLLFRSWDSGHLASQIEKLLKNPQLWQRLSEAGPRVARHYSAERMTDRILRHMGLPLRPPKRLPPDEGKLPSASDALPRSSARSDR